MAPDNILNAFKSVITCKKCREDKIASILNDNDMNIPQPGFVGKNYSKKRILFVDRNPGKPPDKNESDRERENRYMKCLREIGNGDHTNTDHKDIRSAFQEYFLNHHIYKRVFKNTGLSLDNVAILNIVKCRTLGNRQPSNKAFKNCNELHFEKWINILKPNKIVFFGKAPYDKTEVERKKYNINCDFINRERFKKKDVQERDITKIVDFIKQPITEDSYDNNYNLLPEEIFDEEDSIPEGAKKQITINAYERNQDARQKCLEIHGTSCIICNFSFKDKYDTPAANKFIHVHHLVPLSEIRNEYKVNPERDLNPVCPNCHAVTHLKRPPFTIIEMQKMIKKS